MNGVNVVLGVTGGIAAYKACDLVSKLKKMGANVDVIMTESACRFITPLTFQSLSLNRVVVDMFEEPKNWQIEHIALAKKADVFVIVPATANIIGKLANGIADDMLTTATMATKAPFVIAPAMNTAMYENPIVQQNIDKLKMLGYIFIEPETGRLACNDVGKGKLASVDSILDVICQVALGEKPLLGKRILITAGPTVEALDPVRFLSNRSTGKMGYALANQALLMGADVTLITGPTHLVRPAGATIVDIESAVQLYEAVMMHKNSNDIFISAAAVADYCPKEYKNNKIKKSNDDLSIKLKRNPDVAKAVGQDKGKLFSVGFSVETENVIENSIQKLNKKHFDLIVVNDVTKEGAGFAVDTNIVTLINAKGVLATLPKMTKNDVATHILAHIAEQI